MFITTGRTILADRSSGVCERCTDGRIGMLVAKVAFCGGYSLVTLGEASHPDDSSVACYDYGLGWMVGKLGIQSRRAVMRQ